MNIDYSVNTRHKPMRHSRINKANVMEKGWKESNAREKTTEPWLRPFKRGVVVGGEGCVWESRPDGWDPACFSIIHALSPLSSYETYTYKHALAHSSLKSLFQIKCRKMRGLSVQPDCKGKSTFIGPATSTHIVISTGPLLQSDDSFI